MSIDAYVDFSEYQSNGGSLLNQKDYATFLAYKPTEELQRTVRNAGAQLGVRQGAMGEEMIEAAAKIVGVLQDTHSIILTERLQLASILKNAYYAQKGAEKFESEGTLTKR